MAENEELNFDFDPDNIPDTNTFWNGLDAYWNANRQFPQGTDQKLSKKADLIDGKIPSSQLPSYVDDVLEFNSLESLPNPGEKSKIYITTNDNSQYRWSGSEYIRLNADENLMNLNDNQFISGKKSFFTIGGSGYNNHNLRLYSDDGSNPGMTFYKGGTDVAVMYFDGTGNFRFRNSDNTISRFVFAQGFKKDGSNGSRILLGDGTDRPVTDFATATGADAKYIPYTGATTNVNLNTKNIANAGSIDATVFRNTNSSVLVKSFSLHNSTTVTSLGIKLTNPGTSIMMGSFTVTVFGYVGQTISFRVSMYKYSSNWFAPTITWLHGDSSKVSNIAFYKEDNVNLHLKVNFTTNFGAYNKTVITDVLANFNSEALHNPDTYTISVNPDNSTHTLVQTTSNSGFIRDSILSTNANHITTNTTQTGLTGDKVTSGSWTFNSLGINRTNLTDTRTFTLRTNNSIRWAFYLNSESGSGNSGGDFTLSNYSDIGTYISSPLTIFRSTGTLRLSSLAGSDTRMVVTDASGALSTQNIPNISNYLPLTGGTLTGGGKIDSFANIRVQQSATGNNATGLFWETLDDSVFSYGIGTYSVNSNISYGYIGWGASPWSYSTSLAVGVNVFTYKNNQVWHAGNFNPTQYVTQSTLNTQLSNYATLNGVQTFTNTNTFSQSPIVPNATINSHAVNLSQLNSAIGSHTHTFASLTSKPTTLSGYGITDAIPISHPVNGVNTAQINNWNSAFGWSNHAAAGYATSDFVNESMAQITAEFINPDYPISASCKINTVIITEEYTKEYLELEAELIPERQITVTNLAPFEINVRREDHSIDTIRTGETTEYYITAERRLIKKGSYHSAAFLN